MIGCCICKSFAFRMKSRALFGWIVSGFVSFVSITLQGSTVEDALVGGSLTGGTGGGEGAPFASNVATSNDKSVVPGLSLGRATTWEGSRACDALSDPFIQDPIPHEDWQIVHFEDGSLQWVVIPEPAAMLLGSMGFLLILRRRRP